MYNVNDYLVYKNDVCKVKEIKKAYIKDIDYYFLCPKEDESLIIKVPVSNKEIRNIISKEEALNLIDKIKNITELDINDKNLENQYKDLMINHNLEDIIKVIKTTYLRNKKREDEGKKIGEKDNLYFVKAENRLYDELSISLNMTSKEVKNFIIQKFEK